jgi:alkaline phosphatase
MLWDVLAADRALEVILNFADRNPDTLVILASDHGTGGGAIYGIGTDYHKSLTAFDHIADRRASYEFILEKLGPSPEISEVVDAAENYLRTSITAQEAEIIVNAIHGNPQLTNLDAFHEQPYNSVAWVVAQGRNFNMPDHLNIQYSAGQHTAGPVPIAVYGQDASQVQLGLVDNTAVFHWLSDAIGSDHENPIMSEEEALSILSEPPAATGTEG